MILTPADLARCEAIRRPATRIAEIIGAVAEQCDVAQSDITGHTRRAMVVAARDLACFIAAREGFSMAQIGAALNRDHSSVACAIGRERARRAL